MPERSEFVNLVMPFMRAARQYHKHHVVGLDHVPEKGPLLVVVNHSLATYDIMLLMSAIYDDMGRLPRPLIDRLFFKVPLLGEMCTLFGAQEGSPENAESLLKRGEIVTVAPGGMREALRPSNERYQIRWQSRRGFVRLAMKARSPIVLAACPRADDLYRVYPSYTTAWFYQHFRIPFFFARGVGPTLIPRPVRLIHYMSEPIMPPPWPRSKERQQVVVDRFHQKLMDRMQELMTEALRHQDD
jgi:1-acyl-sn-glycerol-3-phosphate acyltransferase